MEGGANIQESDSTNDSLGTSNDGDCGYFFCHPVGSGHRFIALIFMCFLGFGSYFCYDNPGALENEFKSNQTLNLTMYEYTMLYSIYSWPNVLLCFVGGFLIDSVFGIRLATNIYMGLTLIGQVGFALGAYMDFYWLMIIGRLIFGIGGESLAVAQNNYAVLWFKGKELNMIFGLQLSLARIGSSANFFFMTDIYKWVNEKYKGPQGLGITLFIATSTCILSMLCALILGALDKRAAKITSRREGVLSGERVRLWDVKDFKATFWLVSAICVTYYVAIFPFMSVAKEFFTDQFHMIDTKVAKMLSIFYVVSAVVSPLFGFLIDKLGKNLYWILVSVILTILAHGLLAFANASPWYSVIIMSLAYSILSSSLWPLVSLIIPDHQLGTAYGVCQAFQNLGLAVVVIVVGQISRVYGYFWQEIFFIISLMGAFCFTVLLLVLDAMLDGTLNKTPWERIREEQAIIEQGDRGRLLSGSTPDFATDVQEYSNRSINNDSDREE